VTVGERERSTLARVVETFVPEAQARAVADRIFAELEAVGRPKLVRDLVRFLRLIENPLANLAIAGRPRAFSRMSTPRRERYLTRWADSALPLRRSAFQAVKRLSLFVAYAGSNGSPNPLWEGTGYARPPLDAPAAPALRARTVSDSETLAADAIVVGSGAGGAVAAAELARAGKHVLVLEQGGLWQEPEFDGREDRGAAHLYWDRQLLATDDLGVTVFAGSTVGGGTVVNWSTSLRLPNDVRDEWARVGLDGMGEELDAHYDAIEERLHVDTTESVRNAQNALLARGLDALGIEWRTIPRNVMGCGDCGHCGYGCRRGAKQSAMRTYLADAQTNGAEIIADCHADRVIVKSGRVAAVSATLADRRSIVARAPLVVLAGGAIGTPALLLRSGLGGGQVGRSLHLHPVVPVPALYDEPVRTWSGTPQTVMTDAFAQLEGGYGFRLEVPGALPGVLAAALPWRGAAEHRSLMRELDKVAVIIPIVRDREAGRVVIDRAGRPVVRYRVRGLTARHCVRAIVETALLHLAAGAQEALTLHTKPIRLRRGDDLDGFTREVERRGVAPNRVGVFSAHQMSTARMGRSRWSSVADPDGRVRGVRGLVIADASAFPTASGVNPMLTVMALARRNATRVVAGGAAPSARRRSR
jgi:choline dehydrogenase-like flavoprotein